MYLEYCKEIELGSDAIDKFLYDDDNIYIFKSFNCKETFMEKWKDTESFVAVNIQSNLDELKINVNLAWNIYLIFIVSFDLERNVVNEIQADKYCCKKYIIKVNDITNTEEIKALITKEIPLFSTFNFDTGNSVSSNEQVVKQEIVNSTNNSLLSNEFLLKENISSITSNEDIDEFLLRLEEVYNEN